MYFSLDDTHSVLILLSVVLNFVSHCFSSLLSAFVLPLGLMYPKTFKGQIYPIKYPKRTFLTTYSVLSRRSISFRSSPRRYEFPRFSGANLPRKMPTTSVITSGNGRNIGYNRTTSPHEPRANRAAADTPILRDSSSLP